MQPLPGHRQPERHRLRCRGSLKLLVEEPWRYGWSSLRTSLTRFTSRPWTQARRTVPCFGPIERSRRDDLPGVPAQSVPHCRRQQRRRAVRRSLPPRHRASGGGGNYLLTASDETGRWDCHRAWVVETPRDPADDR
ncbi:MAG: hypothetical protein ACLSVD_11865 [Eggerthellaceae bacterium]